MSRNHMDRRSAVKSLFAISVVAGLEALKVPATGAQTSGVQMTLNLILHGTYALEFDQSAKRTYVRIPTVPTHQYLIGHWGVEEPLAESEAGSPLAIDGISGGDTLPMIDDSKDVVVRRKLKLNPNNATRTLIALPFPKRLSPARLGYLKKGSSTLAYFTPGSAKPLSQQPVRLPMAIVLEYGFDAGVKLPNMGSYKWVPHVNLHIFAESPTNPAGSHMYDSWNALKSLYDDSDLANLSFTSSVFNPKLEVIDANFPLPPGVSNAETLSLPERKCVIAPVASGAAPVPSGGAHTGTCLHMVMVY
jgi:hypothetical protein